MHTSHTPPKHNPGERENDREVCCRTATAIPMSAQNDDEFSLDPTAPRAQPGPDERQSHGGSSPPQPHSSSSSSVTVSRQAPEAMHVGIRPQGMPGFHPAASSASYYPGAVFAGGAASAAPPPGAVPVTAPLTLAHHMGPCLQLRPDSTQRTATTSPFPIASFWGVKARCCWRTGEGPLLLLCVWCVV